MSPKTSPPQTLVALRLKALFFLIWHSALKRGVVVAPQILDFSAEKSPSSFSHVPIFLTRAFPRDTIRLLYSMVSLTTRNQRR